LISPNICVVTILDYLCITPHVCSLSLFKNFLYIVHCCQCPVCIYCWLYSVPVKEFWTSVNI